MRLDTRDVRKRIDRAFAAGREDCYASLTILELVEYIRIATFRAVPSHETLADLGVSPHRVYELVRDGDYRLVYKQDERFEFLIPSWQPA